jgi:hypothetical protein
MPETSDANLTQNLAQAADDFARIIEIAAGHRRRAIAAGFPEHLAASMAACLHDALIRKVLK